MQNYSYIARDNYGKEVRGTIPADGELDLANKIGNAGYYLIRCKIITAERARAGAGYHRMKPKELLDFTIQLVTLLEAGVSLAPALRDLAQDEPKENLQKVISDG
jgi:type IV pilus assembly protein PilC